MLITWPPPAGRYQALKFDVPRFLDTCKGNARKIVLNHGVELLDGPEKQIARVVELAHKYYRDVPVLIIAASSEEQAIGLGQVNSAVNQMDQITQQNAAMVEESTAASHALAQETAELNRLMGRFQFATEVRPRAQAKAPARAPRPVAPTRAPRPMTHGSAALKLAPVAQEAGWEEF